MSNTEGYKNILGCCCFKMVSQVSFFFLSKRKEKKRIID